MRFGQLTREGLRGSRFDQAEVFVTNAAKHFKFEERGTWRIYKKPGASEVSACRLWLAAEMAILRPEILVWPGCATAQSVFGPEYRVTRECGRWVVFMGAVPGMGNRSLSVTALYFGGL